MHGPKFDDRDNSHGNADDQIERPARPAQVVKPQNPGRNRNPGTAHQGDPIRDPVISVHDRDRSDGNDSTKDPGVRALGVNRS